MSRRPTKNSQVALVQVTAPSLPRPRTRQKTTPGEKRASDLHEVPATSTARSILEHGRSRHSSTLARETPSGSTHRSVGRCEVVRPPDAGVRSLGGSRRTDPSVASAEGRVSVAASTPVSVPPSMAVHTQDP
ncbi:MAG: hypothetical protein HY909_18855 [Deltaproteobacteria bacterium]|nr:hypothetical protein [Deltaproteobacteria bacterium]